MWKLIRASVTGTAHASSALPCQDHCLADTLSPTSAPDCLVCLVSDGAGSAKQGRRGAELACTRAWSAIKTAVFTPGSDPLNASIVRKWVKAVRRSIQTMAKAEHAVTGDYACTLLGAVIGADWALFFQIGDGGIVASVGGAQGVVFWPDTGPYANMTYFITDKDALTHLRVIFTRARIEEIALFSDGLQRMALSFQQLTPHTPFFEPMLAVLRKKRQDRVHALDGPLAVFLNSLPVNRRTDDDKTLVLATRRTP